MINTMELAPNLQKLIDMGESGTDILHGELKNLMYKAEQDMVDMDVDDPIYPYMEGLLDAYVNVYQLTYALAFAIDERTKSND
jgi:hypothetical protein